MLFIYIDHGEIYKVLSYANNDGVQLHKLLAVYEPINHDEEFKSMLLKVKD